MPALFFLFFNRSRFSLPPLTQRIWTLISIMTLVLSIGLLTIASSTAVDRLALYLIPIQLFVGARLPDTSFLGLNRIILTQLLDHFFFDSCDLALFC